MYCCAILVSAKVWFWNCFSTKTRNKRGSADGYSASTCLVGIYWCFVICMNSVFCVLLLFFNAHSSTELQSEHDDSWHVTDCPLSFRWAVLYMITVFNVCYSEFLQWIQSFKWWRINVCHLRNICLHFTFENLSDLLGCISVVYFDEHLIMFKEE